MLSYLNRSTVADECTSRCMSNVIYGVLSYISSTEHVELASAATMVPPSVMTSLLIAVDGCSGDVDPGDCERI